MTDDSKATPRPWRQGQGTLQDGLRRNTIYAEDGSVIRLTRSNYNADAALIITAVNAHDALVGERDRLRLVLDDAQETLKNIEGGYHVPGSMLSSKEVFRAEFAPFLQKRARDALARMSARR